VQLAVTHIDRDHRSRSSLQKAIGETSRRCAYVCPSAVRNGNTKLLERTV
jgi:hypothetical protein